MVMVLDCSVVATSIFEEVDGIEYADAVFDKLAVGGVACVPAHWPAEVGNAITMSERRKRHTEADRSRFLDDLSSLRIEVEESDPVDFLRRVLPLASEHRLTAYDAAYLELAMRKGLPLATLDKELKRAAKQAGVKLVEA
jgi:predicted nucleic acid-binding protein